MNNGTVFLGVWTNWSDGRVMGATLTTTRNLGNLLIAFTAFLIPYVAARFWRIFCFILHRTYSTADPRDALHHQRQVVLRNSSSPESGFISLFNLLWAWGIPLQKSAVKTKNHLSRLMPSTIFAICCISAFTVAGGLSSQVSTSRGDVVLLKGDQCGILNVPSNFTVANQALYFSETSNRAKDAENYAQQCYSTTSSGMLDCDRFVVRNFRSKTTQANSTCPFSGGICRNNETALVLDSGYLDSNDDFGLNTPPDQRLQWRYVLQCAPLITDGFTSQYVDTNNDTWVRYNYGPWAVVNETTGNPVSNYTFEIPSLDSQYSYLNLEPGSRNGANAGQNYGLRATASLTIDGNVSTDPQASLFIPVPQLRRSDGDVSVILLSGNGVEFYQEMDDDWYRATRRGPLVSNAMLDSSAESTYLYVPEEAGSPLGCVEQWQYCLSGKCGPLASFVDSINGAAPIFNMTADDFNVERVSSTSPIGSILIWPYLNQIRADNTVSALIQMFQSQTLSSQRLLQGPVQYPLPRNQWQLDVSNWFDSVLADYQAIFAETALGTNDPILKESQWGPVNDEERKLCRSQKIRSTAYASFSLFALLFTYLMSVIIIAISFIVEPILTCRQRRRKYRSYASLEWNTNTTLQLHRLTQEELGMGTWEGCNDMVPTTKRGEMMATLDIGDLDHPVLARSIETKEDQEMSGTEEAIEASNEVLSQQKVDGLIVHVEDVTIDDTIADSDTAGSDQSSSTEDEIQHLPPSHALRPTPVQISK